MEEKNLAVERNINLGLENLGLISLVIGRIMPESSIARYI